MYANIQTSIFTKARLFNCRIIGGNSNNKTVFPSITIGKLIYTSNDSSQKLSDFLQIVDSATLLTGVCWRQRCYGNHTWRRLNVMQRKYDCINTNVGIVISCWCSTVSCLDVEMVHAHVLSVKYFRRLHLAIAWTDLEQNWTVHDKSVGKWLLADLNL